MQDDPAVGEQSGAAYVEPVSAGVLIARREVGGIHPLGLHAQHHHRVGSRKCVVEVVGDRARPGVDANGHEGGWGHQRHLGTEGVEKQDIGAGHPAVEDIAHDDDPAAIERTRAPRQVMPERVGIQQRLGRMLMGAVAGVDDDSVDPPRVSEAMGRATCAVADDDRVGAHGLQGERGVLEALSLGDAGSFCAEGDDVRGEPLGRSFKRDARARGVLEEQVDHRATAQRRQLLDGTIGHPRELGRGVENGDGVVAGEVCRTEQVLIHPSTTTSSTPSSSRMRTRTDWSREVGMFLPT